MMTTEQRVHAIALRAVRQHLPPATIATDYSELEFIRAHSSLIWDRVAALRSTMSSAERKPKPNVEKSEDADETTECRSCNGTGVCSNCGGTGRAEYQEDQEPDPENCPDVEDD